MVRKHGEDGRFVQASNQKRKVKSVRVTDATWQKFQNIADSQNLSTADLIESIASKGIKYSQNSLDYKAIKSKALLKFKEQEKIGEQSAKYKSAKRVLGIFLKLLDRDPN